MLKLNFKPLKCTHFRTNSVKMNSAEKKFKRDPFKPTFNFSSTVELREHVSTFFCEKRTNQESKRRRQCAQEDPNLNPDPDPNHGLNLRIAR